GSYRESLRGCGRAGYWPSTGSAAAQPGGANPRVAEIEGGGTMGRQLRRGAGLLFLGLGGTAATAEPASAQSFGQGAGNPATAASAATPGMYANPYAVPTMNPFMNPYAAMYAPATPQNAALYFFAAQQSAGGI